MVQDNSVPSSPVDVAFEELFEGKKKYLVQVSTCLLGHKIMHLTSINYHTRVYFCATWAWIIWRPVTRHEPVAFVNRLFQLSGHANVGNNS